MYKIFAINPGSTSTKIAMFEDETCILKEDVNHAAEELAKYDTISEQLPYRVETIKKAMDAAGISFEGTNAFVGRSGATYSLPSGTYLIDERVMSDTINMVGGVEHPANLGCQIANMLMEEFGGKAYIAADPEVDEFQDLARVTGLKNVYRKSRLHSLNMKETAIRHSNTYGKPYEDCNYVVCHIGGGVSVSAHRKGLMIDGTDIAGGEGPMAPTRCGTIDAATIIRMCYSGDYTERDMMMKTIKTGGFVDIFGTSDAKAVADKAIAGEMPYRIYWDGMIYQIIKYIGSMAAVLGGSVDAILLGGGIVRNKDLVKQITNACSFIAPIYDYPGEFEMEGMAAGALRVITGKEEAKIYTGQPVWTPKSFGINCD